VQVGLDVFGGTLRRTGEQGPGVYQHERVVVDIDDPRVRCDGLGDLVGVTGGRQSGADVEELAHPRLAGQETNRADEKSPVSPGGQHDIGEHFLDLVTDRAVGGEIVFAAQPVVPDPSGVRHLGVKRLPGGVAGRIVGHLFASFDRMPAPDRRLSGQHSIPCVQDKMPWPH
jgi:hypothetical protein